MEVLGPVDDSSSVIKQVCDLGEGWLPSLTPGGRETLDHGRPNRDRDPDHRHAHRPIAIAALINATLLLAVTTARAPVNHRVCALGEVEPDAWHRSFPR
jgi:hypothetical protein